MTPLEQIAREVAMTPGEISKFLEPFNVDLVSENKVSRHPLRLRRIRFSGTKQSADESGPFNFDHSFSDGCTSIASDKNLTGKTSVIAIAKWALRGEPDSDVSQNVRKWLEAITVQGTVDKLPFAIEFDLEKHWAADYRRATRGSSQPIFESSRVRRDNGAVLFHPTRTSRYSELLQQ
ncbi:MAG: hypothetical protein IPQ14_01160 [Candidatus Microthrix sp.]|uniref:hypothetical protein n=1 Tax=Candidatus Neomicrothrix sp. TaxID=2719034 RepID=UPI0025BE2333|nr:hypothetical protein [Candidatus Microthrix sp.]MBL0202957.1 hypothetical protein [Candidatus Microthrix sp.]